MLDIARTIVASLIIAAAAWSPPAPQKPSPSEILSAAAHRGKALLEALRYYSYYTELTIETVSQSDTITGKYYRLSQTSFDPGGNRREKVLENSSSLPPDVRIGSDTADNLTRVYQFIVTPETIKQYDFNYVGRERIDELDTLVFDVEPAAEFRDLDKRGARYLKGRVWIDEQDLCAVKVSGQVLPEQGSRRTPKFETYFQNHDKYWFPAYTAADDSVRVGGYFTRVLINLRFTGYKKVSTR